MFHYLHDKFIPNLLIFMNSPSINKHKDLSSLLEDGEMDVSKNTPVTSKNHIIVKETDG